MRVFTVLTRTPTPVLLGNMCCATVATIVPLRRFRGVFTQEVIGSGAGKLENKPEGVARNTWSRFPVSVINSFDCETDEIDICAFPFCKYGSVFGRFEDTDSSSKSFADDFI